MTLNVIMDEMKKTKDADRGGREVEVVCYADR
jgi:hypothetical protein